jgi:hypothetical protein
MKLADSKAPESERAADAAAPADAAPAEPQTTISTSRGFVDFLPIHRLSIALTSYQIGQLMLIGPLLDGRLSVFQRIVHAMGLWASPQRLYLSTIAQIWRLENVLGQGQLANQQSLLRTRRVISTPMNSASTATTGSFSSTPNIRVLPPPTRHTASSPSGSRVSSPRSHRRTAVT